MKFFIAILALAIIAISSADQGFVLRSVNTYKPYDFGRQYTAVVYKCMIPRETFFVEGINATYWDGKGQDDVEALHIVHQQVTRLPRKVFDFYKNINHIHIIGSGLETLDGEQLDSRIRYLHLDGNVIKVVPKVFFEQSQELMLLSMERNRIETLDADLFVSMPKLRWVSFAGNRIRTLPGSMFRVNTVIECLSFENNGLVSIGNELVKGLDKLKGVSFDGNVCINSAYSKESNVRDLLTQEFIANCAGRCGQSSIESQNSIRNLEDRIKELESEAPKCSGQIKKSKNMKQQQSSESDSDEDLDKNMPAGKQCPHAHYEAM
ncbi:phospholipase A2 inhibitor beta-like [Chironomus tepperi]|uniref:phospholipase A2 inhibitor beta-like n=1 Tax=Chironomus tepperi TaxID=113505 RepID=UPI00391F8D11